MVVSAAACAPITRQSRWRFLTAVSAVLLLLSSHASVQSVFPAEASGFAAATDALLEAYSTADVVVLGEGHGRQPDSDFRVALARNPKFAQTVRVIVLELPQ